MLRQASFRRCGSSVRRNCEGAVHGSQHGSDMSSPLKSAGPASNAASDDGTRGVQGRLSPSK